MTNQRSDSGIGGREISFVEPFKLWFKQLIHLGVFLSLLPVICVMEANTAQASSALQIDIGQWLVSEHST